jgi:hypothetical protein
LELDQVFGLTKPSFIFSRPMWLNQIRIIVVIKALNSRKA